MNFICFHNKADIDSSGLATICSRDIGFLQQSEDGLLRPVLSTHTSPPNSVQRSLNYSL